MKFKTKQLAHDFLVRNDYLDIGRGQYMGKQDCRTIEKLPSGMFVISGVMIPSKGGNK